MLNDAEISILRNALGEYMTDAYGTENAEGCWSPEQWKQLQDLDVKLFRITQVDKRVHFTYLNRPLTGRVEEVTPDGNLKIRSKGYLYIVASDSVGREV